MEMLNQEREGALGEPGPSTVLSSEPTGTGIEMAISTFENLDAMENPDGRHESYSDEANSEMPLAHNGDGTPLSYEEELKQRYWRIRKTLEYQELNDQILIVQLELEELGNLETPAHDAWVKYSKNPHSVFGLTEAEADEIWDFSEEQIEFMRHEGERLKREWLVERDQRAALRRENRRQRAELDRQMLELLGMTQEEVLMVLGRS